MKVADSDSEGAASDEPIDSDTCDETEINQIFNSKCDSIISTVVDKNKYALHIDGTLTSTPNIILGLSDNNVNVYNLSNNQIAKLHSFEVEENVVGVKSCRGNENLFYIGSKNCEIQLVDLRDVKSKQTFKDTTVENPNDCKTLNCFDVSANDLLLCGGTDVHAGDAFILFWDLRNVKLLGSYWESHTDDVTQVKFHRSDPNKLISGSTDGLINHYNLREASEDDALIDSFNTESSVEKLCWFSENNADMIGCVTHLNEMQAWRLGDAEPSGHFRRENIAKMLRRKLEDYCYVADMQVDRMDKLLTLMGSNYGNGECLRGFGFDNKDFVPLFNVKKNGQRVRCSWLNKEGNILITGGENGTMDVWSVETNFGTNNKRKK